MSPNDDLLERLAGEYVLGTLRSGARRRFERWMQQRPALRVRVEDLQIRLAPWAGELEPRSAPQETWQHLETRLFGAAPPHVARAAAHAERRWTGRLAAAWAGVATLALAALAGVLVLAPETVVSPEALALRTQQLPASYVAVLSDAEGRPTLVASAARHARRMELKVLRPIPAAPGTQWVLRGRTAGGETVLLGRIDLQARSRIALAGTAEEQLSRLASLSVNAEPDGASAPAAPTRVALLQGPCVKVW